MTDTLDFVKNLWGNLNVPGVTGPSLSTEDLDKRISDLKAVEAWLNMNLTMLRGTIQALEVQRGTIATLKSMSASMAQAMNQQGGSGAGALPFQAFFNPPGAGGQAAAPQPAQQPQSPQPPQQQAGAAGPAGAGTQAAGELPQAVAAMPAAVAWWNLLQDQFKQAVASTMSPEAMAGAATMAQDAAARFNAAAKPAAKADAKPDAKPAAKPAAGQPAETGNASAQPGTGNGRPRPAKPKTDKS
jgi:hypothetical protein